MSGVDAGVETTYRMSTALMLRIAGRSALGLGVLWLALVLIGVVVSLPTWLFGGLAALTGCLLIVAVAVVLRPPRVLVLTRDGYSVHHVPASPVGGSPWQAVQEVRSQDSQQGPLVVFELSGGRTSLLPLALLGDRATEAQRDINTRLNAAHGYRRLGEI